MGMGMILFGGFGMSAVAHPLSLKISASMAAACTNCTAVALTGRPAAFV